jgi:hypothetical protein
MMRSSVRGAGVLRGTVSSQGTVSRHPEFLTVPPPGDQVVPPGLLTGALGIALALLGASSPAEPAWARLFLLA